MKERSFYWSDPTGMGLVVERWLGDDGEPKVVVIGGCLGCENEWVEHFRQELPFDSDDAALPGDHGGAGGTGSLKPGGNFPFIYNFDQGHRGYFSVEVGTSMGTEPIAKIAVAIDSRCRNEPELVPASGLHRLGVRVHHIIGIWTHENHLPDGKPAS